MSFNTARSRAFFAILAILTHQTTSWASNYQETAIICERAAVVASRETGVPLNVLRAISLTETGRNGDGGFLPWPWTVNMEGIGKWFDDPESARNYVDIHFGRGARSFDVGCFQINYRWHGKAFESIDAMFDPVNNARYAASFLNDLHDELGSWTKAAGAYHSRTPKYARKYAVRFERILANLEESPVEESPVSVKPIRVANNPPRVNRYPLLQINGVSTVASLVPLSTSPHSNPLYNAAGRRPLLASD